MTELILELWRNFIATLQLMTMDNSILQKHLLNASKNAKYTCKSVQNEIIHIYGSKIKSNLTHQLNSRATLAIHNNSQ